MSTNANNRDMMYLVSKVDILLNGNDDLAKKIADNSKEIKINFAALKNQIRLSKKQVQTLYRRCVAV